MEKFNILIKKSALKQLRSLPLSFQNKILQQAKTRLSLNPFLADGIHIRKLTEGFRLRVGDYRIFYYIQGNQVVITAILRRTSTTYR